MAGPPVRALLCPGRVLRQHVDVDAAGAADDALGGGTHEQLGPVRPARGRHDDVGEVVGARILDHGGRRIGAGHGHVSPPSRSASAQRLRGAGPARLLPPAAALHVDRGPWPAQAVRDAAGVADQRLAAGAAVDVHQHAVAGAPRAADGVAAHVVDHLVVHPLRRAPQRQFAQRRQVARLEVVLDRPLRLLRQVDLAVVQPLDQVLRREVDQLDVVGAVDDGIRHRLAHPDAGDARDHVVQAFDVLDVQRGVDVDARRQQLLDVQVALRDGGCRARWCAPARPPATSCGRRASTASRSISSTVRPRYSTSRRGDRLQPVHERQRFRAAVRLDQADDDVQPVAPPACAVVSISNVLPTPGAAPRKILSRPRPSRGIAVSKASGEGRPSRPLMRRHVPPVHAGASRYQPSSAQGVQRQVEREHVDCASRRAGRTAGPRCGRPPAAHAVHRQVARLGDARHLEQGGRRRDVGVEAAGRRGDQVHRDRGAAGSPRPACRVGASPGRAAPWRWGRRWSRRSSARCTAPGPSWCCPPGRCRWWRTGGRGSRSAP